MKKLCLLLFTAIIVLTAAHAQTGWVNYKFDSKLSVKLPAQPQKYGQNSQKASTKDSTQCIVTLIDLKASAQLDSAALVPLLPTAEFASALKGSLLGQREGFALGEVTIGKWNGHYSYTFEGTNATKKLKTYTFMVVIGNNLYALNCFVPDGNSIKDKDNFFASLKLN